MAAINRAFDAEEDLTESNNQQNVPGSLPTRQDQLCRVDVEAIDESLARKQPQIFAALPAILGAFVLGTYLGWCSPVQPQLKSNATSLGYDSSVWNLSLDDDQMSWVGSLINVGAVIGCLFGGALMDRSGRKMTLVLVFLLFTAGWLFIMLAVDPSMLYVGRIIGGLAGGICCVVAPSYIGETSTIAMRGSLGMLFSAMMSAGILGISLLSWLEWRLISAICCIQPLVALATLIFVPDSPYFLLKKGRIQEAEMSLRRLRGSDYNIKAELCRIEAQVMQDVAQDPRFSDLFRPALYKPILIGIGLMIFQQACGINAALFNSVEIFRLSGSSLDGVVSAVILNVILLLAVLSSTVLVERLGRRSLFLLSETLTCVSVLALGGYFYVLQSDPETAKTYGWVPITLLIIFIVVFAVGIGPLPWLVVSEIMPAKFKGPGSSIVACTNWIASFVVTKVFIDMQRHLTNAGTFWMFGGLCFVGIFFGIFIMPETKGKSPQQIQELFHQEPIQSESNDAPRIFSITSLRT